MTQPIYTSHQHVFDKVTHHLLTQMKRSVKRREEHLIDVFSIQGCMYRSPKGLKCAVGCLIPDEVYDPEWESVSVSDLLIKFQSFRELFSPEIEVSDLLFDLQVLHDTEQPRMWKNGLEQVAKVYNLQFNPP